MRRVALAIVCVVIVLSPRRSSSELQSDSDLPLRLAWSTYLGGSATPSNDTGVAIGADRSGNVWVAGNADSRDFPLVPGETLGPGAGFLTKFSAAGQILFSTHLPAKPGALAIDATGDVYIGGRPNGYVAKVRPDGSLVYFTAIRGAVAGIAVDRQGNAAVAGQPQTGFQTVNALQAAPQSAADGFVAKLDPTGHLLFATYLGGSDIEVATDVAVDASGDIYVVGITRSLDFPTTPGAFQRVLGRTARCDPNIGGSCNDGFMTKLRGDGTRLLYSTFIGGNAADSLRHVGVDAAGNAYVTGSTSSGDFPLFNSLLADNTGTFVAKMNPTGSALVYSTFLPGLDASARTIVVDATGRGHDSTDTAIAVDGAGRAYVAASSRSTGLGTPGALQRHNAGGPIYKSTDGGATWDLRVEGLSESGIRKVVASPGFANVIFALGSVLFRSTDGGASWRAANRGLPGRGGVTDLAVDPQTPAIVYAAVAGAGAFKSLDAGDSWVPINNGLTNALSLLSKSIAVAASMPSTVYLGTANSLFKSLDGGSSWVRHPVADVYRVLVDPLNADAVYVADEQRFWRSRDGGNTWRGGDHLAQGALQVAEIFVDPSATSILYARSSFRVYRSTDAGTTWELVPELPVLVSRLGLLPTSPVTVCAATEDGRLFKSVDHGQSWSQQTTLLPPDVVDLSGDPLQPRTLYLATAVSSDVIIESLDEPGTSLRYLTYLGGRDDDIAHAIAVDANGIVYITGDTRSSTFPAIRAAQPLLRGEADAFVAVITSGLGTRPSPRFPFLRPKP